MTVKQSDMREDYSDALISDFSDPVFRAAFQQYFGQLGITVKDWDGLFREMSEGDDGEKNAACVRLAADGSVIGFILFIPIRFTSWFFEETCGFIREFWVAEEYRNRGHGGDLLALAEARFRADGRRTAILTTGTAGEFYRRHGYAEAPGCRAKNTDAVFVKRLE